MDESLFELFGDLILNILFIFPGAFVRWLWGRRRLTFHFYLKNNPRNINAIIGFCVVVAAILPFCLAHSV